MPAIRTHRRPMAGWWRKNPFYLWYMLREASCVFIVGYALWLLCGVLHAVQGRAAYARWRALLDQPLSIALHAVTLAIVLYHAWTWFKVMPKTLPFVRVGGKRVADSTIVGTGVAAAAVLSALLFVVVWGVAR
jgi:fumarate reductase subunit C